MPDVNTAIAQAVTGYGIPTLGLEFSATLGPWQGMTGKAAKAPGAAALGKIPRQSTFQTGDEHADRTARDAGVNPFSSDWLSLAKSQIGSPYVWDDSNPQGPAGGASTGFDCSGFTMWVLGRMGITTSHNAGSQQDQFGTSITAKNLQPGDLVFYHYTDRNGVGKADHVEIYIGNGKTIGSSGGGVLVRDVDWSHFMGGGRTGLAGATAPGLKPARTQTPIQTAPSLSGAFKAPAMLADPANTALNLRAATVALYSATLAKPSQQANPPQPAENGGSVKQQLYDGFMHANRPDLAKMVYTRAFETWVRAESGWQVDAASPPNNAGQPNYGLFQFSLARHPWVADYLSGPHFTASPFEQAVLVARYFGALTPADIRGYAAAINGGSYHGWPT